MSWAKVVAEVKGPVVAARVLVEVPKVEALGADVRRMRRAQPGTLPAEVEATIHQANESL